MTGVGEFAAWVDTLLAGTGITAASMAAVADSGREDAAAVAMRDGWRAGQTGLRLAATHPEDADDADPDDGDPCDRDDAPDAEGGVS